VNPFLTGNSPLIERSYKLQDAEHSLQAERKRWVKAEQALEDIERECKEPFIVPALLKAFINYELRVLSVN
jgi:hypothetical protein